MGTAGLQKMLDIRLAPDRAQVTVTGSLKNDGLWPIETYPWGLTQVRPGGFVVLPQNTDPLDQYGLIANRSLVMWPYAKINDPRLLLGDRYIFVHADPSISIPAENPCEPIRARRTDIDRRTPGRYTGVGPALARKFRHAAHGPGRVDRRVGFTLRSRDSFQGPGGPAGR